MHEDFIKMKAQPGCKYIVLRKDASYLVSKTHSDSHEYFSGIIKLPTISIYNIFALILFVLPFSSVEADFIQLPLNQNEM